MQMEFVLNKSNGWLWYVGRMVLQLYYYPWLGGLTLAVLLGGGSVLINRVLHIPPYFKWIGYIPALAYLFAVSYSGLDVYFETETGTFFGWPCAVFVVFLFLALLQLVILLSTTVIMVPKEIIQQITSDERLNVPFYAKLGEFLAMPEEQQYQFFHIYSF